MIPIQLNVGRCECNPNAAGMYDRDTHIAHVYLNPAISKGQGIMFNVCYAIIHEILHAVIDELQPDIESEIKVYGEEIILHKMMGTYSKEIDRALRMKALLQYGVSDDLVDTLMKVLDEVCYE